MKNQVKFSKSTLLSINKHRGTEVQLMAVALLPWSHVPHFAHSILLGGVSPSSNAVSAFQYSKENPFKDIHLKLTDLALWI